MKDVIRSDEEFQSIISRIRGIILQNKGELPQIGTRPGKDLEMLMSMAYEYIVRTDPRNPDPMDTIMKRLGGIEQK